MLNFRNFHWNISWTVDMHNYANEWVDVVTSQFSIYFVHRNYDNPIFQLWESKTYIISTLNIKMQNVCSDICWYGDMLLHVWTKKKIVYIKYKYMEIVRRWDHQLTHLHFHIDCSRMFHWKLLIFYPIYIKFSLFYIWNVLLFLLNQVKPGPNFPLRAYISTHGWT